MPKLTAAELKTLFDLVAEIKTERLEFCLAAAERLLRSWVSDAVYDAANPGAQIAALKFAEAHLAVYHLLLNSGVRIRRAGLVKREQDAGGSVTNNVVTEYYDIKEIVELRKQFYTAALDAAEPLRTAATVRPKNQSLLIKGGWSNQ